MILGGLLSICTRKFKVAFRRGVNFEGWREDGISSLTFVEVAFPPNCTSSTTLSARISLILNIMLEDD